MKKNGWVWLCIGVGAAALIVLLVCLLQSCRKNSDAAIQTSVSAGNIEVTAEKTPNDNVTEEPNAGNSASDKTEVPETEQKKPLSGDFEMHFIDVGQGDSTLIICDGEAMLVDAGNEYRGTAVQLYLKKHGVSELKYAICTHPDSDHIGGMDVIVTKFDISAEQVFMTNYISDVKAYRELLDAITYRGYDYRFVSAGEKFTLGGADIEVLSPVKGYDTSNNNSLVLMVTYGCTKFLLTGDAGEQPEADMAELYDLDADVLKVGHHGSFYSTSEAFYKAISPEYAVISVASDNKYGHPADRVTELLKDGGTVIYRTDLNGSITVHSDGNNLEWTVSKAEDISEADTTTDGARVETMYASYVVNGYSRRFHLPECESVLEMSEKNRIYTDMSREECIDSGLIPCGRCNP